MSLLTSAVQPVNEGARYRITRRNLQGETTMLALIVCCEERADKWYVTYIPVGPDTHQFGLHGMCGISKPGNETPFGVVAVTKH